MANYFKKTQKRAIIQRDGLFIVKTPDMCTYHRSFEDACDSYHMVYGQTPIAGPLDQSPVKMQAPVVQPDATATYIDHFKNQSRDLLHNLAEDRAKAISDIEQREATFKKMADTYAQQVESFEAVMKKSHGIVKKVQEERVQRMKDRVKYCEAMISQSGNETFKEAA